MSYALLILYFIAISVLLWKWKWVKQTGIQSWVIVLLFALKVMAGIGITYVYETHYQKAGDIYLYFNDAQHFKHIFLDDREHFLDVFNETNTSNPNVQKHLDILQYWSAGQVDFFIHERKPLIMINFLISFISFGNIYIHCLWMSLIAFIGQLALFYFIKREKIIADFWALLIVFMLPTLMAWSATLLKEPLIILALGLVLYYAQSWAKRKKFKYGLAMLFFLLMGMFLKAFVVISALLPLFVFFLFKSKPNFSFKKQSIIVLMMVVAINITFYALSISSCNVYEKISHKQAAFVGDTNVEKTGSYLEYNFLEPTFWSIAENSLPAFSTVMFKPFVYDMKHILYLPDIFQNVILLLLVILIPFKMKYIKPKDVPFLWFMVLYVFFYYTIIGLVVPVLGAIVRYKIMALPFVFVFLMSFLDLKEPQKANTICFNDIS